MARDSKSATIMAASPPRLQSGVDVQLDRIPRRGKTEQNSCHQGNRKREYDDRTINPDVTEPRYVAWIDRTDELQTSLCNRDPCHAAEQREKDTLGEQLPHQPLPACAKGG